MTGFYLVGDLGFNREAWRKTLHQFLLLQWVFNVSDERYKWLFVILILYWCFYYLGCLLHVLASFPESTKLWKVKSIISSCVILTEDHMKFLPQQSMKYLRKPKSKVVGVPEEETRKIIKKKNKEKGQSSGSSSDSSLANQKKPQTRKEGKYCQNFIWFQEI